MLQLWSMSPRTRVLETGYGMLSTCYALRKEILGTGHRMTKNAQKAWKGTKLQYQKAIQQLPPNFSLRQERKN